MNTEKLAAIAYDSYCGSCSWRSVNGEALPSWDQLPEKIRKHWIAAAAAVRETIVELVKGGL